MRKNRKYSMYYVVMKMARDNNSFSPFFAFWIIRASHKMPQHIPPHCSNVSIDFTLNIDIKKDSIYCFWITFIMTKPFSLRTFKHKHWSHQSQHEWTFIVLILNVYTTVLNYQSKYNPLHLESNEIWRLLYLNFKKT